jgi:predicted phage terminase large subunit-like protein
MPLEGVRFFHCSSADNPFISSRHVARLKRQYGEGSNQARQELGGEFVDSEGALFQRSWFPVVDYAPQGLVCCRAWDLAGTAGKGDYTVGCLMGRAPDGVFYILDVRRDRLAPGDVEALVKQTATLDGRGVEVFMEQEPGSAGKSVIDRFLRLLAGWMFTGERSTGDKVTRARPLAAQAQGGLVKLVRADWNKPFLDEAESFPGGQHDDQVDAAASALARLAAGDCGPWDVSSTLEAMRGLRGSSLVGHQPGVFSSDGGLGPGVQDQYGARASASKAKRPIDDDPYAGITWG